MEVTPVAESKIAQLIDEAEFPDSKPFLRVGVSAGGCSGLRYQTYFDDKELEGDQVIECSTFSVRIDKLSAPYLSGASMDYVESIDKIGFIINNPNALNSCACGDSFS